MEKCLLCDRSSYCFVDNQNKIALIHHDCYEIQGSCVDLSHQRVKIGNI
jgi:hypothetical protein